MTTHLAYLQTFLDTLDAAITTEDFGTKSNKNKVGGTKVGFIEKSELYSHKSILEKITYLYSIELRSTSHANVESLLSKLIQNIKKVRCGETITSYTKPTTLSDIEFLPSGEITQNHKTGNWYVKCKIKLEWEEG